MSTKLIKVPKLKTGNDKEVAAQLKTLVSEAQIGLRRVVALGLFCFDIKSQLPHGQFQPWLKEHCEDLSLRSLKAYMQLTAGVLKKCGTSVKGFLAKGQSLPFSHSGEILLLPDNKVPDAAKPLRDKICSLIDGKSQSQLFFEFKQADEDSAKPKRGRLKGQGGASKEQRLAAQMADEKARIAKDELDAKNFCKWIDQVAELTRLPKISDKVWQTLFERQQLLGDFMKRVNESRASTREMERSSAAGNAAAREAAGQKNKEAIQQRLNARAAAIGGRV
jgi:hypothetical protein